MDMDKSDALEKPNPKWSKFERVWEGQGCRDIKSNGAWKEEGRRRPDPCTILFCSWLHLVQTPTPSSEQSATVLKQRPTKPLFFLYSFATNPHLIASLSPKKQRNPHTILKQHVNSTIQVMGHHLHSFTIALFFDNSVPWSRETSKQLLRVDLFFMMDYAVSLIIMKPNSLSKIEKTQTVDFRELNSKSSECETNHHFLSTFPETSIQTYQIHISIL